MGRDGVADARLALPAHPSSASLSRDFVRDVLVRVGREDLIECALLVTSELVTNAVVHAGTEVTVEAVATPEVLMVQVTDGSPHLPVARNAADTAATGRGLRLVRRLVDHWGVVTEAASKTVWFELHSADRFNADNPDLDRTSKQRLTVGAQRSTNSALVTLLDVPLLLHAAWQVHVDALLREYLLAQLGDDTATAEIEEHAAAHDAMALLREQIPKPVLSSDVHELMSHATEPEMTAKEVILEVPLRSVNNFRTLDVRCEAALVLADHEKLITPPTQPEIRMLRWWLCEQVLAQIAGASPTSWTQVSQNVPVPYRTTTSDIEEVSASDRALIAADRSDQIVAVSRGALELLRYATADELVAHRLIDIIPARFRQAHLAGFTLYLSTGRSPLLGQAVTVPALTKDNQEVIVRLTVTAHNREGEATLFVAEFEPSSDAEDVQGHGALSRSGCP